MCLPNLIINSWIKQLNNGETTKMLTQPDFSQNDKELGATYEIVVHNGARYENFSDAFKFGGHFNGFTYLINSLRDHFMTTSTYLTFEQRLALISSPTDITTQIQAATISTKTQPR
jgi:hypothetical protein